MVPLGVANKDTDFPNFKKFTLHLLKNYALFVTEKDCYYD
jgi:hypothetical protein